MEFPKFGLVRQRFDDDPPPPVTLAVEQELLRTKLLSAVKKGDRVLLTAGSRGISSKPEVLSALIAAIRERGGEPLLFPAMGSHGRAEASGQVAVLTHLGVTEAQLGAPVYDRMDMVEVGKTEEGLAVFADRIALEADHILLVNRIKEHTEYIGATESGLLKIAVIGLGRQIGAEAAHRLAVNISYFQAIHAMARVLFERLNILGGVAVLEDRRNRFRRVESIFADDLFDRAPVRVAESREHKPKLPFDSMDVLLVDEIGKEISGAGFDTKVVGRIMNVYEAECKSPAVTRIVLRDLSNKTQGNAIGIGIADYVVRRAVDKIDPEATLINCVTGVSPEKGRIPLTLPDDRTALETAFRTIGRWTPETVTVLWIQNTAQLEYLAVSEHLFMSAKQRSDLETVGELFSLPFDASGNLAGLPPLVQRHAGE